MNRILYTTNGNGIWHETKFAEQCDLEVCFNLKCQSKKGHDGPCWAYKPDGSYVYSNNHILNKGPWDVAGGSIPPGHRDYINPIDKQLEYYLNSPEVTEVTDPELKEKLENDEYDGDSCVVRPCDVSVEDLDLG